MKINSAVSTKVDQPVEVDLAAIESFASTVSLHGKANGQGRATLAAQLAKGKNLMERHNLTFVSRLGIDAAQRIAGGETVTVIPSLGTKGQLTPERKSHECALCDKVHGDPLRPENEGKWNVSRLALAPLFIVDGKLTVISESCSADYILYNGATPERVKRLDVLASALARFIADRKRREAKSKK